MRHACAIALLPLPPPVLTRPQRHFATCGNTIVEKVNVTLVERLTKEQKNKTKNARFATHLSCEGVETLIAELPHGHKLHDVPRSRFTLAVLDANVVPVELLHQSKVGRAHPDTAADKQNRTVTSGCKGRRSREIGLAVDLQQGAVRRGGRNHVGVTLRAGWLVTVAIAIVVVAADGQAPSLSWSLLREHTWAVVFLSSYHRILLTMICSSEMV